MYIVSDSTPASFCSLRNINNTTPVSFLDTRRVIGGPEKPIGNTASTKKRAAKPISTQTNQLHVVFSLKERSRDASE
jgi:hypothetical protein